MTLGDCWLSWETLCQAYFLPNRKNPVAPEELVKLHEFVFYIADALQHLRSQVAPNITWGTICLNVIRPIITILTTTDVEVYCYCLDALGDIRRNEKTESNTKRYAKKLVPFVTPFKDGRYLHEDKPTPVPFPDMFFRHRVPIYLELIKYFVSDVVRASIPEGKCIIFSGAIELLPGEDYENWRRVPPLRITRRGVYPVKEIDCDAVAEGDLQVFQMAIWAINHYPKKGKIMIFSQDGDIPVYSMLMLRVFLKLDQNIQIYCKTVRAARDDDDGDGNDKTPASRKSAASSSSSSTTAVKERRKSDFQDRYIDICGMLQYMSMEAERLNNTLEASPSFVGNRKQYKIVDAAAEWTAAIIISSSAHDYVDPQDFRYYVLGKLAMRAYAYWRHYFTPLVRVTRRRREGEEFLDTNTPHHHVYYVHVENVSRYVDFCYYEKVFEDAKKKGAESTVDSHDFASNDKLQPYDPELMTKAKAMRKNKEALALKKLHAKLLAKGETRMPTQRERLVSGCARLAWVLHYGGAGAVQESTMADGLKKDPTTGLSIHGFKENGFDWIVSDVNSEWRKCG